MSKPPKNPHPHSYESKVAKIEDIIQQIETGHLEMTEIFKSFTLATQYLRECEDFLAHHQQQLDICLETLPGELDF